MMLMLALTLALTLVTSGSADKITCFNAVAIGNEETKASFGEVIIKCAAGQKDLSVEAYVCILKELHSTKDNFIDVISKVALPGEGKQIVEAGANVCLPKPEGLEIASCLRDQYAEKCNDADILKAL